MVARKLVFVKLTSAPYCAFRSEEKLETTSGVQTGPGATQFTRMPFSSIFAARPFVKPAIAALVVA